MGQTITVDDTYTPKSVIVKSSIDIHISGRTDQRSAPDREDNPELDTMIESSSLLFEVKSLRVKDSFGELGFYTGAISKETGLPHGYGRVNFKNGTWCDCYWEHGRFARHYGSYKNKNNGVFNNNQFMNNNTNRNLNKKLYSIESLTDGSVLHDWNKHG